MKPEKIGEIAMIFLAFQNHLKIYHWQTESYSRHMATNELVGIITEQIDRFMETLQGSRDTRLVISSKDSMIKFVNQKDENATMLLLSFKNWLLKGLPDMLQPFDKDLSNIRDEILSNINKTIYLFSLV